MLAFRFILCVTVICLVSPLAAQQFEPRSAERLFVPNGQVGLTALFDADGDGDLDLFSALGLFENVESGSRLFELAPGHIPLIAASARSFEILDVDGDFDLDILVVVDDPTSELRLLVNDGTGQFVDATFGSLPTIDLVRRIDIADIDGDGDPDISVARGRLTTFPIAPATDVILVNTGSGTFVDESFRLPVPSRITRLLRFVDVENDGDADLIAVFDVSPPELWSNDGSGVFSQVANALPTQHANFVAAGDLDSDGDADLTVVSPDGPFELIYENDGSGTFSDRTTTSLPPLTGGDALFAGFAAGRATHELIDIDLDGDLDLFGGVLPHTAVRLNDSSAGFSVATPEVPFRTGASVGDVDADGDLDVIGAALFTNDGAGVFEDRSRDSSLPLSVSTFGDIEVLESDLDLTPDIARLFGLEGSDVDRDGDLDLVGTYLRFEFLGTNPAVLHVRQRIQVLDVAGLGTPSPTLELLSVPEPVGNFAPALGGVLSRLGDVDGDGDEDLVTVTHVGGYGEYYQPRLYESDGAGTFTDVTTSRMPSGAVDATEILLLDVDADQDLDLFIATGDPASPTPDRLFLNDGSGGFTDVSFTQLPMGIERSPSAAAGDIDGDGDLDIVVSRTTAIPISSLGTRWLRNDGNGFFVDAGPLGFVGDVVRLADLESDGDLDVLAGSLTGPTRAYHNDGLGVFTLDPSTVLPADSRFEPTDVDRDGDVDIVFKNEGVLFNRHRQLELRSLARTGVDLTIQIDTRPSTPGVTTTALVPFVGFRPARIDTGFGELGIDPATLVPLPAMAASSVVPSTEFCLRVPADPALHDRQLFFQAVAVELPSGKFGLTNSASTRVIGG